MSCAFDGCERPVEYSNLCAGHRKQKLRGQPLRPLRPKYSRRRSDARRRNPESDRLERAALALADADSDDEYERALRNLRDAARWYGTGMLKSRVVAQKFAELRAGLRNLKASLS